MAEEKRFAVIVIKNNEGHAIENVLIEYSSREEAENQVDDWSKIFNSDVFFDPVPILVIRKI